MKISNKLKYSLATSIALTMASAPASAAIDELVVTAQKRAQSIQDVPIAISAFDANAIKELGATSLEEMSAFVPGAELFDARGAGLPTWVIRGVGLADFNANNTPTAAVYYDEVYMTSNALGGIGLFDVERVEVLKGPQGGLYGRNTTGGAVRILSAKPGMDEYDGYAQASYGSWDQWNLEGAVGGPIVEDKLAFRLAAMTEQGGGWQDSLVTPEDDEHGDRDFLGMRGSLLFTPNEDVDILFKIDHGTDKSETTLGKAKSFWSYIYSYPYIVPCGPVLAGQTDDANCLLLSNLLGDLNTTADQSGNGDRVLSNPINELDNKWTSYNLNVDWDLGFANLVSISSYVDYDFKQFFDYDATPAALVTSAPGFPDGETTFEQWSQEFRLISSNDGPFTWLVGAMYGEDTNESIQSFVLDGLYFLGFTSLTAGLAQYEQKTETWAVYGQAGYDVTDTININGSLRYTEEDKNIDYISLRSEHFAPLTPYAAVRGFETSLGTNWSGHVGIDWKPNDNTLVYAKYSRGFKSGGFFAAFTDNNDQLTPYTEEVNDAYEIGVKMTPLEDFQFNAAIFHYDYKDAQGAGTVPSALAASGFLSTITTLGDAEHTGMEIDAVWTPSQVPGFSLAASVAMLDAEITSSDEFGISVLGMPVSYVGLARSDAPDLSYTINAGYEKDIANGLLGSVQAVYSWRDDLVTRDAVLSAADCAVYCQDDYGLLTLRAGIADVDQGWEIAIMGENVTDEEYSINNSGDDGGSYFSMPGRPASWKIQGRMNF